MKAYTLTDRFLSLFTTLRPHEGRATVLLAWQAFFIMFAYYMLRIVREPLILAEGSAELKAYTNAMQAVLLMFIVPVFARVYHKLGHEGGKHQMMSWLSLFFVINLVLFALAYNFGWSIGIAFYVWLGIFSVMVLALFWAFSADLYNVRSGQRLFPVIAAAGSGGALMGARFAGYWDPVVGHDGIMLIAAACLLVPWWLSGKVEARIPPGSTSFIADEFHEEPPPLTEGFMVVFRSYYLTMIAFFVIVMNLINTNGEYILTALVLQEADVVAAAGQGLETRDQFITQFYSTYNTWFAALSFLVQLFIVSRLFDKLGLRGAILIFPLMAMMNYALIFLFPVLAVARVAMIAENSTNYSLQNTIKAALYLPVRREEKYVGKNCIDTFFYRIGDVFSALVVFVASELIGLGFIYFVVINACLALLLFWLSRIIGSRNEEVIEHNFSNMPPQVGLPIPDMQVPAGKTSQVVFDEDSFIDPDEGDALKYRATLADGDDLPRWVRFDALHRRFRVQPPADERGSLEVKVVARDYHGLEAAALFRIYFG